MKIIKKFLIGITLVVSIFILSSCVYSSSYYGGKEITSGDFVYRIDPETDEAMIYSFSEEGKTKETIVISTMIDGHKVTTIGNLLMNALGDNWYANFESENLKNLYFHSLIVQRELDGPIYGSIDVLENVFWSIKEYDSRYCAIGKNKSLFVSKEGYVFNDYKVEEGRCIKKVSNISYHLNDGSEYDIFFVDHVDDGGKANVIPPNPLKDGSTFLGWYKEPECINLWDFENDEIPKPIYDEETNELTNITRLYAKWGKVE